MKSTRLINTLNKKRDLWIDSETYLLSPSDNDSNTSSIKSVNVTTSTSEISESSKINCCLICSMLSSLSNINCCSKHLELLTTTLPPQIGCMMPPQVRNRPKLKCSCQSHCPESKRQHRFRSSSLLASKSRHQRRKSSVTLTSFNTNDSLLSPNEEGSTSSYIESRKRPAAQRERRSNYLSSSSINSSMNNNNSSRKRISPSPSVTKRKQQNIDHTESILQTESTEQIDNQSTSLDLIESDGDISYTPRISLKRVIHIKDDDEELIPNDSQITLNMAQATKQMVAQANAQAKILLKRVCLEE